MNWEDNQVVTYLMIQPEDGMAHFRYVYYCYYFRMDI